MWQQREIDTASASRLSLLGVQYAAAARRRPSVQMVLLLTVLLGGAWQGSINLGAKLHWTYMNGDGYVKLAPASTVSTANEVEHVMAITHHKTGKLEASE